MTEKGRDWIEDKLLSKVVPPRMRHCDGCKADGFFSIRKAQCPGCEKTPALCPECWAIWIGCSPVCRLKWRKEAEAGIPKDKLGHAGPIRKRKPKGMAEHQEDMFR